MIARIQWIDGRRNPKVKPNPDYPNGIDLDMSKGKDPTCFIELPYPAKRIGHYIVSCEDCGLQILITTAGRPDDPRSVKLACRGRSAH